MPARSINLSDYVINKLSEEARSSGKSLSFIANFHLSSVYRERDKIKHEAESEDQIYKMVHCLICGAEYSSRLNECPQCIGKKIAQHDKEREAEIKNIENQIKERKIKKQELIKISDIAEQELAKVRAANEGMNDADWESYGRKEVLDAQNKYQNLNKEIVDIETEINLLEKTLNELRQLTNT